MACAANYAMADPRNRADLGMMGAQALTSVHTEGKELSGAALDEANAFSYLRTPEWLWPWMAAPPLLAAEVWSVLPLSFRSTISKTTWVAPQYCRLPMGFAHSVHILMSVNLRHIGIVLFSSSKTYVNNTIRHSWDWILQQLLKTSALTEEEREFPSDHLDWCCRHAERLHPPVFVDGLTLDAFASVVRTAKLMSQRIVIVCLAFTGCRRAGDIQDWLEGMAASRGTRN